MFSFYQHSWQISFQKLEAGRYELHVGKKILVRKKSFTLANICFRFIDRRWQIPFLKENLQKILSLKIKKIVFVLTQKRPNTFHCHSVIIQNNLGLKVSHWNFELFSQILFGSNYFWSFQLNFFKNYLAIVLWRLLAVGCSTPNTGNQESLSFKSFQLKRLKKELPDNYLLEAVGCRPNSGNQEGLSF